MSRISDRSMDRFPYLNSNDTLARLKAIVAVLHECHTQHIARTSGDGILRGAVSTIFNVVQRLRREAPTEDTAALASDEVEGETVDVSQQQDDDMMLDEQDEDVRTNPTGNEPIVGTAEEEEQTNDQDDNTTLLS